MLNKSEHSPGSEKPQCCWLSHSICLVTGPHVRCRPLWSPLLHTGHAVPYLTTQALPSCQLLCHWLSLPQGREHGVLLELKYLSMWSKLHNTQALHTSPYLSASAAFQFVLLFLFSFFGGTSIRIKDLAPVMQAHRHLKQVSSAFCFSKSADRFDCSFPGLGLPLLGLQVWATRVQLVCSNRTLNILPRMSLNCDSPDLLKVAEIIVPQPDYLNKIQLGNPTGFHIE